MLLLDTNVISELMRSSPSPRVATFIRQQETDTLFISSLSEGMPPGTLIGNPEGGLSLWVTLPEGTEVSELYYRAVRRGVAFVAGEVFYASHVNPRTLRVSFGLLKDEVLEEGVARLCSVAKDLMRPRSAPSPIFT